MDNEDGLTVTAVWFCDCLDRETLFSWQTPDRRRSEGPPGSEFEDHRTFHLKPKIISRLPISPPPLIAQSRFSS